MAQQRRQMTLNAMKPRKPRPSYQAVIHAESLDRSKINNDSFDRLLEFYGREPDPEKVDLWLESVYPTRGSSATICGIKKRLERYRNRLLMESDPKENGITWFFTESKVGSRYPEVNSRFSRYILNST